LPEPFKILHTPGVIIILASGATFRQAFIDGRKLPADPSPAWQGYSVGRWDGDTLVVDTAGFNDLGWLDSRGTGHSEEMRVEERFRRRDYGHLELTITMTDPKTFTKPIGFSVVEELLPDTDLFEHYCLENERTQGTNPSAEAANPMRTKQRATDWTDRRLIARAGAQLRPARADAFASYDKLPDWSGAWSMVGGTVFDRATQTGQGGAITPGMRSHPP
jgi:hypothetical protein